jgi:hypothetical protein
LFGLSVRLSLQHHLHRKIFRDIRVPPDRLWCVICGQLSLYTVQ